MNRPAPEQDIVLIVDDVPENLAVLSDALDAAGYMVIVAVDGESALERLRFITPDIILLDAVMPGMDGFEVCRQLKTHPTARHIPVVFMTGLTEPEHVVRGFGAGGVDYVTKPIHTDEVLARIQAHLHTARLVIQAHQAIDLSGHAVLVLAPDATLSWHTPRARRWLEQYFPDESVALPHAIRTWALDARAAATSEPTPMLSSAVVAGRRLHIQPLGRADAGELLLLLTERDSDQTTESLMHSLNLTSREAEVLLWAAKGKTNRDIGEILGISPRTVNKHLDHVYEKLGVETRTAAAALAMGAGRSDSISGNAE